MGWLDLEQPQPQFNPMGWLGGAQIPTQEDPSVALARRMRQQSPNVPSLRGGGDMADPASKYDMPLRDEYRAGVAAGVPSRGVGPAPIAPQSAPAEGGGNFAADFNKGMRRVLPPWWQPENVPKQSVGLPGRDFDMVPPWMRPQNPQDVEAGVPWNPEGPAAPTAEQHPLASGPLNAGDMEEVFPPPSVTADGQPAPGGVPGATGNVPMPRPNPFAAGAGAQLPPNATSAVGAPPAPQPQPQPSLLDRIGNGLNNNSELLLSLGAGFAGAPSFGAGMQRAFSNARPLMGRNQTVDALVKRGMPEEMARAAVGNPEVLKQVLPQFFGAKQRKFTQIGEDMMGNKRYGFVDEVSNKVYDLGGNEISHSQQGANIPTGADGQPLAGEELRAHIAKSDPMVAAALKDMYEGKQNPNARNLQKLAPLASLVYPGFDATDYPNRLKLRNSYTSGADHKELEAINTVSGHMGKLMDSADKLGNTGFKPWNTLTNFIADKTVGSPALVRFRNDLVTTQNELAKAYHGGHVSDSAFNAFNKAINESQTPDELKASIGELAGLLHSKIATKENSYRVGMQHAPLPQEYSAMSDEAKNAFSKIHDWSVGNKPLGAAGAAVPAAPAPAPAPGKYIYDPKTGAMVRQQ